MANSTQFSPRLYRRLAMKRFLLSTEARRNSSRSSTATARLTHAHLIDAATILAPQWRHLSPCFGAALQGAPLKSNLLRLGQSIVDKESSNVFSAGNLAKAVHFQPHPGAPMRPTRNKSMAAAHLTQSVLGTLMGTSLTANKHNNNNNQDIARKTLRDQHGMKSNHVNGQWTGASLARWHELIQSLNAASTSSHLSHALWSMILWEISHSKACLLDAFLAMEQVSNLEILDAKRSSFVRDLKHDVSVQEEWASAAFAPNDLSPDAIQSSLDHLLHSTTKTRRDDDHNLSSSLETARSMAMLCASLAVSHATKPATPHGHHGCDGGDVKPDCVEVCVRESMDLLLWDDQHGSFDLTRLPTAADSRLFELCRPINNDDAKEDDLSATTAGANVWGGGQEWFDALSNLPGCDHLSTGPNGTPFELTPTLRNAAKVFRRPLLLGGKNGSAKEQDWNSLLNDEEEWSSLLDLKAFWKPHQLQISLDTLTHRAGMSDDLIVHEVATVALEPGARNAIDMRLRCDWARNTGFATFTHLRQEQRMAPKQIDQLLQLVAACRGREGESLIASGLDLLILAVAGDHKLTKRVNNKNDNSPQAASLDESLLQVLSVSCGLDRRELMRLAATSDMEREEKALQKAMRQSEQVLKTALFQICHFLQTLSEHDDSEQNTMQKQQHCHHQEGILLLAWILGEMPDMDLNPSTTTTSKQSFDSSVEQAMLSLPTRILADKNIQNNLRENPFVRGPLLCGLIDWQSGNASFLEILKTLGPSQMIPLLLQARRFPR